MEHFRNFEHKKVWHAEKKSRDQFRNGERIDWVCSISGNKIYPPHTFWGISRNLPYCKLNYKNWNFRDEKLVSWLAIAFCVGRTWLTCCPVGKITVPPWPTWITLVCCMTGCILITGWAIACSIDWPGPKWKNHKSWTLKISKSCCKRCCFYKCRLDNCF